MPCSPRRRIRLVTVAGGFATLQSRSGLKRHRRLGTSNGCRDHTVLPYTRNAVVLRALQPLTRFNSPCEALRADALASITPRPAFVTLAIRPSCRERDVPT